jgi:hypothetical protein
LVRKLLSRSRGRELPGSFNPLLVGELFRDQSVRWEGFAREHVKAIWVASKRSLEKLCDAIMDEESLVDKLWKDAMSERHLERNVAESTWKHIRYGQSFLSWAAAEGYADIVLALIEHGNVDLESRDETWGQTPLSWAAENGHDAVIRALLQCGLVNADATDHSGRTPLSRAAENGHESTVELLIDCEGVSPDAKIL